VQIGGAYSTFNTFATQGVQLAPGVTLDDFNAMLRGITFEKINGRDANGDPRLNRGTNFTDQQRLAVPLDLIAPDGRVNQKYITWNTTPGTIGQILYVPNKNTWAWNAALMKNYQITERVRFQLYADAQNIMNHPFWGMPNLSLSSTSFGTIGAPSGNRTMTFRGTLNF
jgi:hypothetical protein